MQARRILIVDGDAHVRALVGGVLRSGGIDFDEARDGADALHSLTVSD